MSGNRKFRRFQDHHTELQVLQPTSGAQVHYGYLKYATQTSLKLAACNKSKMMTGCV